MDAMIPTIARLTQEEKELLILTSRILEAKNKGDAHAYKELCAADMSCFEDVCPHRIDGVEFHTALIRQMAQSADSPLRVDILEPRVQLLPGAAVVTYTRLTTYDGDGAARWTVFNETRVFGQVEGAWKMVHFHRSKA
ncbi:MAG: nuclear transport factor 2 family protein [Armatimonadetes bacterium]|nr:nuclear transport factor 2 family protein [Armatimonadota bacterium]